MVRTRSRKYKVYDSSLAALPVFLRVWQLAMTTPNFAFNVWFPGTRQIIRTQEVETYFDMVDVYTRLT
jgi:hypothetical protein